MPITIKKTHVDPAVAFNTLNRGDPFLYNNSLCIKVQCEPVRADPYFTAIELETGRELEIDEYSAVVPVKATLTYSI